MPIKCHISSVFGPHPTPCTTSLLAVLGMALAGLSCNFTYSPRFSHKSSPTKSPTRSPQTSQTTCSSTSNQQESLQVTPHLPYLQLFPAPYLQWGIARYHISMEYSSIHLNSLELYEDCLNLVTFLNSCTHT